MSATLGTAAAADCCILCGAPRDLKAHYREAVRRYRVYDGQLGEGHHLTESAYNRCVVLFGLNRLRKDCSICYQDYVHLELPE